MSQVFYSQYVDLLLRGGNFKEEARIEFLVMDMLNFRNTDTLCKLGYCARDITMDFRASLMVTSAKLAMQRRQRVRTPDKRWDGSRQMTTLFHVVNDSMLCSREDLLHPKEDCFVLVCGHEQDIQGRDEGISGSVVKLPLVTNDVAMSECKLTGSGHFKQHLCSLYTGRICDEQTERKFYRLMGFSEEEAQNLKCSSELESTLQPLYDKLNAFRPDSKYVPDEDASALCKLLMPDPDQLMCVLENVLQDKQRKNQLEKIKEALSKQKNDPWLRTCVAWKVLLRFIDYHEKFLRKLGFKMPEVNTPKIFFKEAILPTLQPIEWMRIQRCNDKCKSHCSMCGWDACVILKRKDDQTCDVRVFDVCEDWVVENVHCNKIAALPEFTQEPQGLWDDDDVQENASEPIHVDAAPRKRSYAEVDEVCKTEEEHFERLLYGHATTKCAKEFMRIAAEYTAKRVNRYCKQKNTSDEILLFHKHLFIHLVCPVTAQAAACGNPHEMVEYYGQHVATSTLHEAVELVNRFVQTPHPWMKDGMQNTCWQCMLWPRTFFQPYPGDENLSEQSLNGTLSQIYRELQQEIQSETAEAFNSIASRFLESECFRHSERCSITDMNITFFHKAGNRHCIHFGAAFCLVVVHTKERSFVISDHFAEDSPAIDFEVYGAKPGTVVNASDKVHFCNFLNLLKDSGMHNHHWRNNTVQNRFSRQTRVLITLGLLHAIMVWPHPYYVLQSTFYKDRWAVKTLQNLRNSAEDLLLRLSVWLTRRAGTIYQQPLLGIWRRHVSLFA